MSRIDEALKRAEAAAHGGAAEATVVPEPAALPGADPFKDPWSLEPASQPAAAPDRVTPASVTPTSATPPSTSPSNHPKSTNQQINKSTNDTALAVFQGFSPRFAEKIVATPSIRPAFVEQYRKLASTLHHAQIERSVKVVMVTSALAGEGKTLTCTNLALTLSESYQRSVLLIDADLRRPALHEIFQIPNLSGLGDGLRADTEQKLALVEISPRLTILTAGRPDPDPMSGLTSERMRRVIEEAASRFDWVLVDTPPVGLLPDANLLARMVDTALLVVQAGKTPYQLVQRAMEAVGRERILGVVLNQAEEGLSSGYHYYSYYDHYTKRDGKKLSA